MYPVHPLYLSLTCTLIFGPLCLIRRQGIRQSMPGINIYPLFYLFYSGVAVCVQVTNTACSWTPRAEYKDRKYYRTCKGLSTIPDDIPAEAVTVFIRDNSIRRVPADVFSQLSHCTFISLTYNEIEQIEPGAFNGLISLEDLYLYNNKLSVIEPGTFNGLISLQQLYLQNNMLSVIEPGTFSQLPALASLHLNDNKLTTLPWTVFTNGTGNITRPASLQLRLEENPLQRDTSLCWVKQAEQDGWIPFSDVNLQCDTIGK